MWQALQILGFPAVSHGFDCVDWLSIGTAWKPFVDRKWFSPFTSNSSTGRNSPGEGLSLFSRAEWDGLLSRYDAIVDWPASFFADDLVRAYPDAKFIYTHREVDKWYASNEPMIREMFAIPITLMRYIFEPLLGHESAAMSQRSYQGFYGGSNADEVLQNAKQRYKDHWEMVKGMVPPEQLLEYELGSGWEPLCTFLGKDVPEGVDFPWVNEQKALMLKMKQVERTRLLEFIVQVGKVIVLPLLIALGARKYTRG